MHIHFIQFIQLGKINVKPWNGLDKSLCKKSNNQYQVDIKKLSQINGSINVKNTFITMCSMANKTLRWIFLFFFFSFLIFHILIGFIFATKKHIETSLITNYTLIFGSNSLIGYSFCWFCSSKEPIDASC